MRENDTSHWKNLSWVWLPSLPLRVGPSGTCKLNGKYSNMNLNKNLRSNVGMHQTNSGKSPKICFHTYFYIWSPICSDNCGVVFFVNIHFNFQEMIFFVLPLKYANFHCVTNILDLWYFCQHNPLFYHLNLFPCHYWSWQRNIFILVNIFVRPTFLCQKVASKQRQF